MSIPSTPPEVGKQGFKVPDYNRSPKARFRDSGDNVSKHSRIVESAEFVRGCDFALMQMFHELAPASVDANTAAKNQMMLTGAQLFLNIFRTLGQEPMRMPTIVDRDNLTHAQ
jgi:hypothetical protein